MSQESNLIFKKLCDIQEEVGIIGKDRKNEHQGFKFRGIDDVMNELHDLFAKHRVFIVPQVLKTEIKEGVTKSGAKSFHQFMTILYHFKAEDGSSVSCEVIGEAADTGDKSTSKCMAIGLKYALTQMFTIPTAEAKDPDAQSHEFKSQPINKVHTASDPILEEPLPPSAASQRAKNNARFDNGKWKEVVCHFGKNKGTKLGDMQPKSLHWYKEEWQPKPFNGVIDAASLDLREALDAAKRESDERKANEQQVQNEPDIREKEAMEKADAYHEEDQRF